MSDPSMRAIRYHETGAPEVRRDGEAGEPDRRELGEERHRELPALAPLGGTRHDPFAHEGADRVAHRELVVPVAEVHYGYADRTFASTVGRIFSTSAWSFSRTVRSTSHAALRDSMIF